MRIIVVIFSTLAIFLSVNSFGQVYSSDVVKNQADYIKYVQKSADIAKEWARLTNGPSGSLADHEERSRGLEVLDGKARMTPTAFIGFLNQALQQPISNCDVSMKGNVLNIGGDQFQLNDVAAYQGFHEGTSDPRMLDERVEFYANLAFGPATTPGYLHVNLAVLPDGTLQSFHLNAIHPSDLPSNPRDVSGRLYSAANCNIKKTSENWIIVKKLEK
jgi:hypothetical protein